MVMDEVVITQERRNEVRRRTLTILESRVDAVPEGQDAALCLANDPLARGAVSLLVTLNMHPCVIASALKRPVFTEEVCLIVLAEYAKENITYIIEGVAKRGRPQQHGTR
jgi:hypothetical protein